MAIRREQVVREHLESLLVSLVGQACRTPSTNERTIGRSDALACVEAGFKSRLLDLKARELKNDGTGYYTIGSAGHEANAVIGRALRATDPCLLHYRSGALLAARSARESGDTFLHDTLLSLVASADDPVSGGRHKVWGSERLWVPPQTSTIASHLPKATGMAFALERAKRLGVEDGLPDDAIVMASFGDASINHASATTAINSACWAAHQNVPMPILFVCEDNGVGISVHTPSTWIRSAYGHRAELAWFEADGRDLEGTWQTTGRAIDRCRRTRRPCFLQLHVVRLLGHAGSDVETLYHEERDIEATEQLDPMLAYCRFVVESGYCSGAELQASYTAIAARIDRIALEVVTRPKIETFEELVQPLAIGPDAAIVAEAERKPASSLGGVERDKPRHMAKLLAWGLADLMATHSEMIVFGEDVAKKGGVYHVTAGLHERFGVGRVFNTLLDETTVLGIAIGAAQIGLLPIPEIQYLAYLHNAEDQLRGEACSQRFFSNGRWDNPMVVRIASFGYQKGFGGHFHNDDSIAVLRDIPGLVIAVPSRGDDAVMMLRTCVGVAKGARAVCAFLEPIALYMTKDLFEKGDAAWSYDYPEPGTATRLGEARHYEPEDGGDPLLIVTYGNGVPMALRARREIAAPVHVMDLRWLAPLPVDDFLVRAVASRGVLVVDECRRSGGGVAEALLAALAEEPRARTIASARVTAADSYVPLGDAANLVLPQEADIVAAARALLDGGRE